MHDEYKISQRGNDCCFSDTVPQRIAIALAFLDKVFRLDWLALMDIPFPPEMNTSSCFAHPIWELLTEDQKNRVNTYGMSFDPFMVNQSSHIEFANKIIELHKPKFLSFYYETRLDRYDNFNTDMLSSWFCIFLTPDEQNSIICYDPHRLCDVQYGVCSFVYEGMFDSPGAFFDVAVQIYNVVKAGKSPLHIAEVKELAPMDVLKCLFYAMIGVKPRENPLWDVGLYVIGYIVGNLEFSRQEWLAVALFKRLTMSNDGSVLFCNQANWDWFNRWVLSDMDSIAARHRL